MPVDTEDACPPSRCVLVVGANGFLGGFIVSALLAHGNRVLRGIRLHGWAAGVDERDCDLSRMCRPEEWREALQGVDAVVNVAGILRETRVQKFDAIHVATPLALAQACVDVGIKRFVQVSALGRTEDGEFIASKHRFDEALRQLPLSSVVLRPSVVYATSGSYGGTSLLRALAAMPGMHWLPGHGRWLIQPVAAEDLGELVARSFDAEPGVYEVGAPEPISLRDYQQQWRRWLRIPGVRVVRVPEVLVELQVAIFEAIGRGPVGRTMWRMLRRGNVTGPSAHAQLQSTFGFAPRALADVLATRPSQVQDRWQARLYFIAPLLAWSIALLWLLSAWAGLVTPAARIEQLLAESRLAGFAPVTLARVGGVIDLLLGLWLATGIRPRLALGAMAACVIGYTLALGLMLPSAWLDPLGGLAKNLVVLPALAVAWVLADRR
jgi:uncharacterized protein YbjT (DUF2867 family)